MVGTSADSIITETSRLLQDQRVYDRMSRAHNPYGDGRACERIISFAQARL
jgi:UDP-N-acetylglucosamine 2-epimerase (non-hydrolysing)